MTTRSSIIIALTITMIKTGVQSRLRSRIDCSPFLLSTLLSVQGAPVARGFDSVSHQFRLDGQLPPRKHSFK